jgi:hypothetical protein
MRFWTTDWSYNDFFNRLRVSRKLPPEVATWHTKIRRFAYMLGSSSVLQSDQSSSRAPFESPPPKSDPAFLLCTPVLYDGVSYVQNHKPIDIYIRNIMPLGIRLPRQRSWDVWAGALLKSEHTRESAKSNYTLWMMFQAASRMYSAANTQGIQISTWVNGR